MYEAFYGLREKPFNLTPDPRYLYLSEKHKEAFAHLLFGIKNRSGFVMVSGEIGTGKTTICRTLLNQLDDYTEVAFIFNPFLSPVELMRAINEEFGIPTRADTVVGLHDELNRYLLQAAARGKNCVLVIDEAQNLEPSVLEQIRLLSNLETETQKLLQIVLIGQPELAEHLALPELRQLNQRITARYHLRALSKEETLQYIAYRLRVAGGRRRVRFTRGAVKTVYRQSKGTPRVINAICDRALLIGYTKETRDISSRIVKQAAREIRGERVRVKYRKRAVAGRSFWKPVAAGAAAVGVAALVYVYGGQILDRRESAASTPPVTPVASMAEDPAAATPARLAPPPVEAAVDEDRLSPPLEEAVAAAPLTPVERLETTEAALTRKAAAAHLLRRWNLALLGAGPEDDSADALAAFVESNGLTAEVITPTFDQLAALNLPAFIKITDGNNGRWVALSNVGDKDVEITIDAETPESLPRAVIAERYAQEAVVPWRDPAPDAEALRSGQRGASVESLQAQLKSLNLLDREPSGFFGPETHAAVEALQEKTGLAIDGVAGRQTRMVLSSWLGAPETTPALGERPVLSPPALTVQTAATSSKDEVAPPISAPSETNISDAAASPVAPTVAQPVDSGPVPAADDLPAIDTRAGEAGPNDSAAVGGPATREPAPAAAPEQAPAARDVSADVTAPAAGSMPLIPIEENVLGEGVRR